MIVIDIKKIRDNER